MRSAPTFDEIQAELGAVEAIDDASCDGFDGHHVTFTIAQLETLVRRLGWRSTPSLAECLDDQMHFICPTCQAPTSIEHESDGPCDLRPVRGFNPMGHLIIQDVNSSCCNEGDWWLRCRSCLSTFNPPTGLDIAWT